MNWKKFFMVLFLIVASVVLGALIGVLTKDIGFLSWLGYSKSIGINTVHIDLSVLQLDFGLQIGINVAQVLLLGASIPLYRKIRK